MNTYREREAAQKEHFCPYANGTTRFILQALSDKFLSLVNDSLVPVIDEISQIRVPQDYVSYSAYAIAG
ncbi:DUF3053 family protein, partial [Sodalis-like endosymbiont of Proechinophthirus fluctus]|uniref:DUF3053 family protein n=1 Tax=Sodalis-like endosymbiont of Proechinophthirus fluctus TaxID=1462730 RepID=UPI00164FA47D